MNMYENLNTISISREKKILFGIFGGFEDKISKFSNFKFKLKFFKKCYSDSLTTVFEISFKEFVFIDCKHYLVGLQKWVVGKVQDLRQSTSMVVKRVLKYSNTNSKFNEYVYSFLCPLLKTRIIITEMRVDYWNIYSQLKEHINITEIRVDYCNIYV